jgi:hypothetical protein
MDTTDDEGDAPAGDLLVEAGAIEDYLKSCGVPKPNAYYLKRSGWPIGSTATGRGGKLIASKRRLIRHLEKLARGSSAA